MRALALLLITSVATAQPAPTPDPPKPPPPQFQTLPKGVPAVIGLTELTRFSATSGGFIDDAIATDATRLAYVIADTAQKVELHVVTLATGADVVVDLAPTGLFHPIAITLLPDRALVIGANEDASQSAAMVELTAKAKRPAGTIVYKLGPATHLTVLGAPGKQRLAVHRAVATKPSGTRHELDVVAIETGKRLQAGRGLELDDNLRNKQFEFRFNNWSEGYTRAFGIKAGDFDRAKDARTPDVEATYDLVTGKFIETQKVTDLFEQHRRFQALADADARSDFVRFAWDNSGLQVWKAAKGRAIELDQPLTSYDPKSLQGLVTADGAAWILLKIDPVNAEAVARKKADLEYLDVFRVGPTEAKAVRKARLFAPSMRHRFGLVGDKLWLIERNTGFERGGKSLTIYTVAS